MVLFKPFFTAWIEVKIKQLGAFSIGGKNTGNGVSAAVTIQLTYRQVQAPERVSISLPIIGEGTHKYQTVSTKQKPNIERKCCAYSTNDAHSYGTFRIEIPDRISRLLSPEGRKLAGIRLPQIFEYHHTTHNMNANKCFISRFLSRFLKNTYLQPN